MTSTHTATRRQHPTPIFAGDGSSHMQGSRTTSARTILVLYMEGLTHEEIAGVTGLSQSAVGVRIHRMKKVFVERYVERST